MPPMLMEADLNDDGRVTHAEVDEFGSNKFAKADSNNNGSLDRTEFEAARPAPPPDAPQPPPGAPPPPMHSPEEAFKRADWNGDGKLTLDEFMAPLRGMAVFADADGDSAISRDERGGRRPPP